LQLDVDVHNLHLAVSSIWHENLVDDPAVFSIHLPQLSLTSSAPATPEAPTIWRLRLTGANVHTISSLSASLFPTFARHFPAMPSPAHHQLLSGFSIDGSLLLHAGDSPSACPSKVELKSEIDGGEVKLSADSLATCRYLFASLKCSLLSLRRPKSPVTMSNESGLDAKLVEYPPPTYQHRHVRVSKPFLLIPGAGQHDWNGAFTRDRTQVAFCGARCWTTDGASGLHCGPTQTGG